jgi:lysozyme
VNSVWRGADELWQSFQAKTSSFINAHQGSAIVVPPQARRWPWADILRELPSAAAEETLPGTETQSAELAEQTAPPQHTSADGVRMISGFEGFCANLYDDGSPHCGRGHGHCTIGYGHLVHHGPCDGRTSEQPFLAGISRDQGRQLLAADLTESENRVHTKVTAALTQQQFDALVSFDFNTGRLNALVHDLNSAQFGNIPALMNQFVHAHVDGQVVVLPGLVARRAAEGALFATGQYPP